MAPRPLAHTLAAVLALTGAACPDSGPPPGDAGIDARGGDAGVAGVDVGVDAGAQASAVDAGGALVAVPGAFRFVRLRAPTLDGEDIVRIGLHERARTVAGAPEVRSAPSPEALQRLVALCASPALQGALRGPGDTAPAMTTIELGCAPVAGVMACDANAPCGAAFDDARAAVLEAWTEKQQEPDLGLALRSVEWREGRVQVIERTAVMHVDGKPLLPTKNDPFARAPNGKHVKLCTDGGCVDVTAPSLVHLDVIDGLDRFRCASCVPLPQEAPRPSAPVVGCDPAVDPTCQRGASLEKDDVLRVVKGLMPRLEQRCAALEGPAVVKITWTIQPSGRVAQARPATTPASARARCAAAEVARLRFPPSPGSTPVTFPFRIGR